MSGSSSFPLETAKRECRIGKFEEDKFRAGYHRNPGANKTRSIHFTLLGGRKVRGLTPPSLEVNRLMCTSTVEVQLCAFLVQASTFMRRGLTCSLHPHPAPYQ